MIKVIILAAKSNYTEALINQCHNHGFEIVHVVLQHSGNRGRNIVARNLQDLLYLKLSYRLRPTPEKQIAVWEAGCKKAAEDYFKSVFKMSSYTHFNRLLVDRINDQTVQNVLAESTYDIILVFGTSIIKPQTIRCARAPMINFHSSVLPGYRGYFPEFWQLLHEDYENLGYTFHLIDPGVDTGSILMQRNVHYGGKNPFMLRTLNILDAFEALPGVIRDFLEGAITPLPQDDSKSGKAYRYAELTQDVRAKLFSQSNDHEKSG
jgi:methionyl-tRNA formyltransferase